jgi:hypothetical protein
VQKEKRMPLGMTHPNPTRSVRQSRAMRINGWWPMFVRSVLPERLMLLGITPLQTTQRVTKSFAAQTNMWTPMHAMSALLAS